MGGISSCRHIRYSVLAYLVQIVYLLGFTHSNCLLSLLKVFLEIIQTMIPFVLKNHSVHLLSTCLYVTGTVLNVFLILF